MKAVFTLYLSWLGLERFIPKCEHSTVVQSKTRIAKLPLQATFTLRRNPHKGVLNAFSWRSNVAVSCYFVWSIGTVLKIQRSRNQINQCCWSNRNYKIRKLRPSAKMGRACVEGKGCPLPVPRRVLTRDLQVNMADEVERNRLVAEFSGVTDVDTERAQFYLDSAGWDLHVSILL